ncbi:hypothetical protein [Lachnospira eligens]|jgi:hypothetical protein|uniref:Uncharacterized protein n=1 Tax=Lachnospira eligens TaxID=39485 RepID=A0A175AA86_9FIRM|nr:hypothetical protein [Lachnospira eligens]CUQ92200.1 Uncharacterised protein [Lachnospira eligens]
MKYRGIELKENTEAEILIALEVTGITDDEELENYIDEISERLEMEVLPKIKADVYIDVVYDNLINVRINDQTFDEKGVYIVTSLYNEIRSKAYDNVNCSIGVNVDTFFTDDDGTEYNEDLVTLEQFMSRLEM